jgi:hypothetical protein
MKKTPEDEKTYHAHGRINIMKMVYSTKSNWQIQCNFHQHPNAIFINIPMPFFAEIESIRKFRWK